MNKIRIGNPEYSILAYVMGIFPLLICIGLGMPIVYIAFILVSIVMTCFAVCWLPYLISKYQLRPGIDRCHDGETTWLRITKDLKISPQFVTKGPYGQTKGVTYGEKADVIDDGSFQVHWLNGNSGIVMYDLMNTSVDLKKSVARKKMRIRWGIRSGVEGYNLAKKQGEVLLDE